MSRNVFRFRLSIALAAIAVSLAGGVLDLRGADKVTLSGRVVDEKGKPMPRVSVRFSHFIESGFADSETEVFSDEDGRFSWETEPGNHIVFAISHWHYKGRKYVGDIVEQEWEGWPNYLLPETDGEPQDRKPRWGVFKRIEVMGPTEVLLVRHGDVRLTANVLGPSGAAPPNVLVYAVQGDARGAKGTAEGRFESAWTNAAGEAEFTAPFPAGKCKIDFCFDPGKAMEQTGGIPAGVFDLPACRSLTLRYKFGNPVAGARHRYLLADGSPLVGGTVRLESPLRRIECREIGDGWYEEPGLVSGSYLFFADVPGSDALLKEWNSDLDGPLGFSGEVERTGAATGAITSLPFNPAAPDGVDYRLQAKLEGQEWSGRARCSVILPGVCSPWETRVTRLDLPDGGTRVHRLPQPILRDTDSSGLLVLKGIPFEEFAVVLIHPTDPARGFLDVVRSTEAKNGAIDRVVEFGKAAPQRGSLSGTLVDQRGKRAGMSAGDAQQWTRARMCAVRSPEGELWFGTVCEDGRVEFPPIPPGKYTVFGVHGLETLRTVEEIEIRPGVTTEVRFATDLLAISIDRP
ncbi:MAG: carboxypeptidase regulatory-like domain-containing protein [Planctomycetes bacterium]|nr:carboxypeptidase regulatory-like domain-containing protein [Planctomycetota bacterium]